MDPYEISNETSEKGRKLDMTFGFDEEIPNLMVFELFSRHRNERFSEQLERTYGTT